MVMELLIHLKSKISSSFLKTVLKPSAVTYDVQKVKYTQYPIIRNGLIRNSAEFLGKFKKRALGRSNLRNASKNLRNGQCSDFQS